MKSRIRYNNFNTIVNVGPMPRFAGQTIEASARGLDSKNICAQSFTAKMIVEDLAQFSRIRLIERTQTTIIFPLSTVRNLLVSS